MKRWKLIVVMLVAATAMIFWFTDSNNGGRPGLPRAEAATANVNADLSVEYKLSYSVVDAEPKAKFSVTADEQGVAELRFPFISGGCIVLNDLKIDSIEAEEDGVKTFNLLWRSDRGAPCKAYMPVQLKAAFIPPGPGRYRVQLWEADKITGEKTKVLGRQELIVQKAREVGKSEALSAVITAIKLELNRAQTSTIRQKLEADLKQYQCMSSADYPLPEMVVETAWVEGKAGENAILYVEGMSRSGPWYHLVGIAGGDYSRLKPGVKYTVSYYKVYPRAYWHMPSSYVHVVDIR